jgi:hypothetical protein
MPHGVSEDTSQQTYSAARSGLTAPHTCQPAFSSFGVASRFAGSNIMHKAFHILPGDGGNLELAKQRLYVASNATQIYR